MTAELRALASAEAAYVAERTATLTESGVTVIPEPLLRLGALASAVAAMPIEVANVADATIVESLRSSNEKLREDLTLARGILYSLSQTIEAANAKLDGSPMKSTDCAVATAAPDKEAPCVHEPPTEAQKTFKIPEHRWPASGLFHGLTLVNKAGVQAVFSEPRKGQFGVQMVGSDGKLCEPFSALDSQYKPDTWEDAGTSIPTEPKWDATPPKKPRKIERAPATPAAARTEPLPGMAAIAPSLPKMSEFVPTEEQVTKWSAKVWPDKEVSPEMLQKIRAAVSAFVADPARTEQRHADPGTLFFYWVMRPDNRPKSE